MKYFIETWGCQMNDHDSEKLSGLLNQAGHQAAALREDADLVLLNTCTIRQKAVQKVYTELGWLRKLKEQRPIKVGVTGCLAQQEQKALLKHFPQVDFVLGTAAIQALPHILNRLDCGETQILETSWNPENHLFPHEVTQPRSTAKALVTIMEGCDHHCTYCVVPGVRGVERSRPVEDILQEIHHLVRRGFREVELLGQNVNSFDGGCSFAELLNRVSEVEALEWIRFTTSNPHNFTQELAQVMLSNPKVVPFLHLPVQSGSNTVLKRMARGYTVNEYLEKLSYLGRERSGIFLSTDFIVGFPGETEQDFQDTLDLMEKVRFEASFSFLYSPRPGTSALKYQDDVPYREKQKRLARLQARQKELTLEAHHRLLGRILPVRVEGHEADAQGLWLARTAQWVVVKVEAAGGHLPFGQLVQAEITHAGPHFLKARRI